MSDNSSPWSAHDASVKKMESNGESSSRYSENGEHEDDGHSAASTASATTASPLVHPVSVDSAANNEQNATNGRLLFPTFGTPSTVSTGSASVDALFDPPAFPILAWNIDDSPAGAAAMGGPWNTSPTQRPGFSGSGRRSMSWEEGHGAHSPLTSQASQNHWTNQSHGISPVPLGPHGGHVDAWSGSGQARVASFRPEQQMMDPNGQYGYPQVPHTDAWRHQRRSAYPPYVSQQMAQLPPSGQYQHTRKGASGPPSTPPRGRQNRPIQPRQSGSSPSSGGGPLGAANSPRSSSEVLKTLLRKKACLYEPDTSRAVALVTWLAGRELALEYGYFSRQQLQSGVHACVAKKIEAGTITRTKVNRCMQIILNSCFHYIIPRPDGSEENGTAARDHFKESTQDDHALLPKLPPPWNDVTVERDVVIQASVTVESEKRGSSWVSPHNSPRLASSEAPTGAHEGDEEHGKRAVLLCFNENVKSAQDVFHCHNEFIRDTANASKLQLTAREWCSFFGRDAGMVGQHDFLGQMNDHDLAMFRTTWCAKRYDHDHDLCGFAHVEVGGGWLRRNFRTHSYRAEMCPNVVSIRDRPSGATTIVINQCVHGDNCQMAHSREEILYHPSSYKKTACKVSGHARGCALGDVCPNLHSRDLQHTVKSPSHDYSHQRHPMHRQHHTHGNFSSGGRGAPKIAPSGSPTLYVSPAPVSAFEKYLLMPGVQNLFRRHSSVLRAHMSVPGQSYSYSNFGDDWGISEEASESPTQATQKKLPAPTTRE